VSFILGSSILHFNMAVKTISVATMLSLRPLIESTIDTCRPSRAREWRLRLGSCRWAAARLIGWFGATTEVRGHFGHLAGLKKRSAVPIVVDVFNTQTR
jgi:hypothetical protein